jgi:hypothetical protein
MVFGFIAECVRILPDDVRLHRNPISTPGGFPERHRLAEHVDADVRDDSPAASARLPDHSPVNAMLRRQILYRFSGRMPQPDFFK